MRLDHVTRRGDLAYVVGLATGAAGLVILGLLRLRIEMLGLDDFTTIWAGPRAFVLGLDPYDPATWHDTAVRVGMSQTPDTVVYLYPPWVTLALVPLALLSARAAGALWTIGGVLAAIVTVRALLRAHLPEMSWAHGVVGFLLLLSSPAAITFLTGQWTFLFVAALTGVVLLLRSDRTVAAGVLAVVMLAKPPLFVFTAAGLVLRALWPDRAGRRAGRRFVLVAVGTAAAVIALSWLVLPSWWPVWFTLVATGQVETTPVTLQTLFVALFGPVGDWLAAGAVLVSTWVALRFDPRSDAWLPTWIALSSANVIYSNTYDALLLVVPIILAAGALHARSRGRAALVIVAGVALLFVVGWYLHTIGVRLYAAVIPLATSVVITACLWSQRRERSTVAAS
jgi:hypothetical protein